MSTAGRRLRSIPALFLAAVLAVVCATLGWRSARPRWTVALLALAGIEEA